MANILVVDDEVDIEPLILQRFRRAIRSGSMKLFFARDGVHALEIMDETPDIALVITDINMPRMDGLTDRPPSTGPIGMVVQDWFRR